MKKPYNQVPNSDVVVIQEDGEYVWATKRHARMSHSSFDEMVAFMRRNNYTWVLRPSKTKK